MITQAYLKSRLHYDPETGVFTWLTVSKRKNLAGLPAGYISDGYILIYLNKKNYRAHRLAWLYMTGEWPVNLIDHKNRIRNDNRWENLRDVTYQVNSTNRADYNDGVASKSISKTNAGRFKTYLYLGTFSTYEEADIICEMNLAKLK